MLYFNSYFQNSLINPKHWVPTAMFQNSQLHPKCCILTPMFKTHLLILNIGFQLPFLNTGSQVLFFSTHLFIQSIVFQLISFSWFQPPFQSITHLKAFFFSSFPSLPVIYQKHLVLTPLVPSVISPVHLDLTSKFKTHFFSLDSSSHISVCHLS